MTMTMLNMTSEPDETPETTEAEQEHLHLIDVTHTARTIARSALKVAHSDVAAAFKQLETGGTEEALQMIAEAREQLEFAKSFLCGRIWELRV